jgi:hypothetical protein
MVVVLFYQGPSPSLSPLPLRFEHPAYLVTGQRWDADCRFLDACVHACVVGRLQTDRHTHTHRERERERERCLHARLPHGRIFRSMDQECFCACGEKVEGEQRVERGKRRGRRNKCSRRSGE